MVWGLFPNDPLPGEDGYYIFGKGTYKVGRKGCDVIVNKDKGVSRIHAEIVVDALASLEQLQKKYSDVSSNVRMRDCSKYGTYITTKLGSKEKVHEFPNKEATLKDGDLVSFGTGNATYRFCFVPLIFYCSKPFEGNQVVKEKISSIGACMTCKWSPDCTHVLVNQSMPLTKDVIDPFITKKYFVLTEWLEVLAEKTICTEIPSCSFYGPTLMLEGVSVKVADPKSRETCLRGCTFVLEPAHKYKFKDKLWSLLEMGGAKVVSVEGFCSNSRGLEDEDNRVVLVLPPELADKYGSSPNLSSLSRVKEKDLICAAFSGCLDPSVIVAAPVVISSSCSTDETVVADSDVEVETAISVDMSSVLNAAESNKHESKEEVLMDHVATRLDGDVSAWSSGIDNTVTRRRNHVDEPEAENGKIIYSQSLVVRDTNLPTSLYSSTHVGVSNFKCFKKTRAPSGNSFDSLIPFSKYPYKDADCGNEEVVESLKEEKKRKQMEAVAEDLFNNEKRRRRGVAGSLQGIFTRS